LSVALSGRQEKHSKISYFAAATARVITNIPTLSRCHILNWVMLTVLI
jgi:hypothetical protein